MKAVKYILGYLFLIGMAISIAACSKNAVPRFYVDIERDFDVEKTLSPIVTHFFELKNVPTNLDSNLELFGLAKENITSINPADARLITVSGLMDWSLVSSVEVYAMSRIDPSNRKRIYYVNSRDPRSNNDLKLFNTFADLSHIMTEERIDLEIRLRTITSISGNFRARILFNYAVFDEI